MKLILLVLCGLLYLSDVIGQQIPGVWQLAGFIRPIGMNSLHTKHRVRVKLVEGGLWESTCGDDIADEDGSFEVRCHPTHPNNRKHLYIYFRLWRGEECRYAKFEDVDLSLGELWEISAYDDGAGWDSDCPKDYYY
ncbi:unnamed protein product [Bursaphelenchus xylophilus]|uniref:(pine wood nematode) hypothetical protein n=1 Tax=Bursaphelenchus xylophilus TaxID=6326 RepID=A0A1I7RQQ5_BURXY|nr:unnamed protein product [Bursaphelenchus xylophilus]CAG9104955.1 unnamed protein product [Bursaphelenchus xylophilus]